MKPPEHHLHKLANLWLAAETATTAAEAVKLLAKAEKRSNKLNRSYQEYHNETI